ncbi:hypothetical protein I4902_18655 [Proteus alimentorum]|uniref:Uncharacterized protein n=1 Tax=Proteus alimentorum TaxID=1973495 RepID=A0ABS0IZ35_9GAMM|nr:MULTISPECIES: hypothetical protein [Proteus]MBG2804183.1 hypothetical protein [Proteus mirabilis]MBG2877631.1 hypothetical protein [Proteus alimentorum]MBG2881265.1 hypothetical protein [Proteus alimentorum]MBI6218374.1 hypothetical protein [Proteus vulgaris]
MQIKNPPSYLLQINKGKRKATTARATFSDSIRLGDDMIYVAKLKKTKPYTAKDMAIAKKLYANGIFSISMYKEYCIKPHKKNKEELAKWHSVRSAMEKLLKDKTKLR